MQSELLKTRTHRAMSVKTGCTGLLVARLTASLPTATENSNRYASGSVDRLVSGRASQFTGNGVDLHNIIKVEVRRLSARGLRRRGFGVDEEDANACRIWNEACSATLARFIPPASRGDASRSGESSECSEKPSRSAELGSFARRSTKTERVGRLTSSGMRGGV